MGRRLRRKLTKMTDYSLYMLLKNLGIAPYDPKTDRPKDVGLGGESTEYLANSADEYGMEMLYPTIWWRDGKPVVLSSDASQRIAADYERAGLGLFPRYDNPSAASEAALARSRAGGAQQGSILDMVGNIPLDVLRMVMGK